LVQNSYLKKIIIIIIIINTFETNFGSAQKMNQSTQGMNKLMP